MKNYDINTHKNIANQIETVFNTRDDPEMILNKVKEIIGYVKKQDNNDFVTIKSFKNSLDIDISRPFNIQYSFCDDYAQVLSTKDNHEFIKIILGDGAFKTNYLTASNFSMGFLHLKKILDTIKLS